MEIIYQNYWGKVINKFTAEMTGAEVMNIVHCWDDTNWRWETKFAPTLHTQRITTARVGVL